MFCLITRQEAMLTNLISEIQSDHAIQIETTPQPKRRGQQTAQWQKPKRKRGRRGSKDSRRKRLQWRNTDKERRLYQQRWMKPSKQPGKKPLAVFTTRSNEMPTTAEISIHQVLNLTER